MVCHSLLQWTRFHQTSSPWPDRLGWPHTAWLNFIELDKAVVLWTDWPVFGDYSFSVSALWCPLATSAVLLGFLWPWTWGISSRLLQQSSALLLTLDEGYLLTAASPDLERGVAPLGPPASTQQRLLGGQVAPLQWGPWPPGWGSSSPPPPITSDVGKLLSAAAPVLSQPGALGL